MAENARGAQAPVNFTRIQETSEGDTEFEKELFLIFLEDCADRLELLRAAVSNRDIEKVHLEAHTIKGAGANVGTTHLHEIAFVLEEMDSAAIPDAADAVIADLDAEFSRVKSAITDYVAALD
ncbi:MAG: Hpt domain-containing protein [Candidatus Hydrogenedentes bacterium]|nr:Hpt domain-containing protein [Candidatus Hydrogenedentota bacterium]